ncbi:MAG: UDP-2,3-diacylglucosamine diphosphatase LpxI [Candidatus Auribacterota bacterium]|jgi:DUF1009 family protein|nr:UDP-2,3-diacylglucosamine diphosphatase LpxI [Candidatus Auribacterota bacterium]
MDKRLGIVAGSGTLPFIVARNARNEGIGHIYAVGFKGQTDPALEQHVDGISWIGLGQIGKLIDFFKSNLVDKAVFIGRIGHDIVFSNLKLDMRMLQLAMKLKDWRTDSILGAIADEITASGITITDSTTYLTNLLPSAGVLTGRKPDSKQEDDIKFGFYIAKRLSGLDIGQTVVVKKKTVLALEAIEGTDKAILRGAELGKKDVVVVKVSKPNQDMRFDVPVIGMNTLDILHTARAAVLAIEAGKTILIDKDAFVRQADALKIAVVAVDPASVNMESYAPYCSDKK